MVCSNYYRTPSRDSRRASRAHQPINRKTTAIRRACACGWQCGERRRCSEPELSGLRAKRGPRARCRHPQTPPRIQTPSHSGRGPAVRGLGCGWGWRGASDPACPSQSACSLRCREGKPPSSGGTMSRRAEVPRRPGPRGSSPRSPGPLQTRTWPNRRGASIRVARHRNRRIARDCAA